MPPQTMKEKNATITRRKTSAYDQLKELAQVNEIMQHQRDGDGYDKLISMLESGKYRLELVQNEVSSN